MLRKAILACAAVAALAVPAAADNETLFPGFMPDLFDATAPFETAEPAFDSSSPAEGMGLTRDCAATQSIVREYKFAIMGILFRNHVPDYLVRELYATTSPDEIFAVINADEALTGNPAALDALVEDQPDLPADIDAQLEKCSA